MRHLPSTGYGEKRQMVRLIERGLSPSNQGLNRACSSGQARQAMRVAFSCAVCVLKPSNGGTFKGHPEVPPDNNQAERSLRLAVTKRKVCGGSRSMQRFAQTADLLSVIQTCRTQGRSVIDFFKQVLKSQVLAAVSKPSLIPQT